MRKMLKIGIFCILFLLCDCQVLAQKCENTPNEATQKSEKKRKSYPHFLFGSIKTVGCMAVRNMQMLKQNKGLL